jgi:acylphosphatase
MFRVHVYIDGKVQGVFFRNWTRQQAQGLGLTGWIRNLADGRVELVAEGDKKSVNQLTQLIGSGPPVAKVTHADVIWEEASGEFKDFAIK